MKFDGRFEENGACQEAAGWKDHLPATPGGTGIDGPLDRRGIHCRSVAARAIVRDVDHKGRDSDFTSAYILNPIRVARLRASHRAAENDQQRSEEHTSELQSLMRISYAVFCLKKKKQNTRTKV